MDVCAVSSRLTVHELTWQLPDSVTSRRKVLGGRYLYGRVQLIKIYISMSVSFPTDVGNPLTLARACVRAPLTPKPQGVFGPSFDMLCISTRQTF